MSIRNLPVRPHIDHIRRQAKDLLKSIHAGNPEAVAVVEEFHPDPIEPQNATLADAQLVLARSYQTTSWTRLVQAVELVDAIWSDDIGRVRSLVTGNPKLIHEHVLIRTNSNWGPPMSYAANLGRDAIIRMLHELGATDIQHAAGRAALQGHTRTALMLYDMAGNPPVPEGALGGPAYTLSVAGTAMLLTLGSRVRDDAGNCIAPADVVLQTDSRRPHDKHAILELYEKHGLEYPDTPPMALHRGRIDLLEAHLARDPAMLQRTFTHREIYPAEIGCGAEIDATTGTPLGGTSLLHMAIEFDEIEIIQWLLDKGADVNIRSRVGANGFGGYTPLFNTVVSMPNFWMNYQQRGPQVAPVTQLLLERGADPNIRASVWKQLNYGHDSSTTRHEYRDVTPLSWGRRFHDPIFVSKPALAFIEAAGGTE